MAQYTDADGNSIDISVVDEKLVILAPVAVHLDVTKVLALAPMWRQMLDAIQNAIRVRQSQELDALIAQRDSLDKQIDDYKANIAAAQTQQV